MCGPRQIEMAAETETFEIPIFDGWSPQKVFALGPGFTRLMGMALNAMPPSERDTMQPSVEGSSPNR